MAAYFTDLDIAGDIEWHVGEPLPLLNTVVEVQADGHELELIKNLKFDLPKGEGKRVVLWKGAAASFIYDQLSISKLVA